MNRPLGILGGMGPLATADFYRRLILATPASCDQEHLDVILLGHASLPDRTQAILGGEEEAFLDKILPDLALLEDLQVVAIAMPCNTAHTFYDRLQAATTRPLIHMVREAVKEALALVGEGAPMALLATDGTIQSGLYQREGEALGLTLCLPSEEEQEAVMEALYAIKAGRPPHMDPVHGALERLMEEEGACGVLLGCTEASLLPLEKEYKAHSIDAMDVLVDRSLRLMGRTPKPGLLLVNKAP